MLWGDPHANVFDSVRPHDSRGASVVNIFGHGHFWVVKSELISMQGRYEATEWSIDGQSAMRALAIGGAFLQNHTMVIEARDGQITWDGEVIMQEFPSSWHAENWLAWARYHEHPEPIDKAQPFRPIHGVDVTLPLGVRVRVNRWAKHLDVVVTMRPQSGGQDGHCGNFNGNSTDDTIELIKERMDLRVPMQESLFPAPSTDDSEVAEHTLADCAPEVRAQAEADCKAKEIDDGGEAMPEKYLEACVYDACFGGAEFLAGA